MMNWDKNYTCEKMNDILGAKMSDLPYIIKYEIVYGFMPRFGYMDELKYLFDFYRKASKTSCINFNFRTDIVPNILKKHGTSYRINGVKLSSLSFKENAHYYDEYYFKSGMFGDEEFKSLVKPFKVRMEHGTFIYDAYEIEILSGSDYDVDYDCNSQIRCYKNRNKKLGVRAKRKHNIKDIIDLICCAENKELTCKYVKEWFNIANIKPSVKITKETKREMMYEWFKWASNNIHLIYFLTWLEKSYPDKYNRGFTWIEVDNM